MKKDKEWLKERILESSYKSMGLYTNNSVVSTDLVIHYIDQLDEPEVTLDKAFEKVAESYLMTKEEIWRHLERLETHGGKVTYDEPEVTEEQVWEKIAEYYPGSPIGMKNSFEHFYYGGHLEKKPVKPVVPQFVADYIEKWKHDGLSLNGWFTFDYGNDGEKKVSEWLRDNDDETKRLREFTLIDAIRYGYEVEKEKKYRVVFNSQTDDLILFQTGKHLFIGADSANDGYWKQHFTEAEIKAIDERYWAFAEEVVENV